MIYITCKLCGGVGNQLFQINAIYNIAKKFNLQFYLSEEDYEGASNGNLPIKYYNNLFSKIDKMNLICFDKEIHIDEDSNSKIDIHNYIYNIIVNWNDENKKNLCIKLYGYFQNIHYFDICQKDIVNLIINNDTVNKLFIRNDIFNLYPYIFTNPDDTCYIGIRRGKDYLKHKHIHLPCDIDYYTKAIKILNKKRYYISTDSIEWCKQYFTDTDKYIFFDIQNDLIQLYIGTFFKNYIISNSSFHWWASYLSKYENPYIIAPNYWDITKFNFDINDEDILCIDDEILKSTNVHLYMKNMNVISRKI